MTFGLFESSTHTQQRWVCDIGLFISNLLVKIQQLYALLCIIVFCVL